MNNPRAYCPELSELDPEPIFVQIARAVSRDVRRGRLRPCQRLPGSRELSQSLGVHRNTVLAAYAELEKEGWIRTEPARGTFVAEALPDPIPRRFGALRLSRNVPLEVTSMPPRSDGTLASSLLPLVGGIPDPRLVPRVALARAYRRALISAPATLSYGSQQGDPRLLAALRDLLATSRGVVVASNELIVTRGSQMGLFLAGRALCRPGDAVAVEALGYPPAWEALRLSGARLLPVPVDRGGLSIPALQRLAESERLKAVYVTPHHQYPTTVTLSAPRRLELLALAERYCFAVIEDDYDHEFHWSGRPVLPLASSDPARVVVYVGTLSKVLAPGLRIGYLAARPEIVEHAACVRSYLDRQGDLSVERAVAELLEDGELMRHVRRMRRVYRERRKVLAQALETELGEQLRFELPAGGLALWARVRKPIAVERWVQKALERGVLVHSAARFRFDGRSQPFMRLGFPALDETELRRAVRLLAQALQASR